MDEECEGMKKRKLKLKVLKRIENEGKSKIKKGGVRRSKSSSK